MTRCTKLFKDVLYTGFMMTSSNRNIFHVTGHLCGEYTGSRWIPPKRPMTRSFDVFFDLLLNKPLSKQSWGWRFETTSRPLWRHSSVIHSSLVCIMKSIPNVFNAAKALHYWLFVREIHRSLLALSAGSSSITDGFPQKGSKMRRVCPCNDIIMFPKRWYRSCWWMQSNLTTPDNLLMHANAVCRRSG